MPTVTIASQGAFMQIKADPFLYRGKDGERSTESGVKLIIPPLEDGLKMERAKRGKIQGMSQSSRKRMFDQMNQIKRSAFRRALFVTLTYPQEWVDDWQLWKRHLQAFLKRLCREYPQAAVLWKLEFQKRGAPHFHFFVFGVRFIPYKTVARWWFEVVGSNDYAHLKAGTEIRRVQNRRKALFYVAKYMAKRGEVDERYTGRVWGVRGKKWLPILLTCVHVSEEAFTLMQSILRDVFQELVGREADFCYGRAGITVYIPEKRALGILAYCVHKVTNDT